VSDLSASNPPARTVDELMGWINQRYDTDLPRAGDLAPGTSLPALWAAGVSYRDPGAGEVVNARVNGAWKDAVTGISLLLSVRVSEIDHA
jgi:hypothetical protein